MQGQGQGIQKNNGTQNVTYPLTNVAIAPDGIVVTIMFSPTITMSTILDGGTCDQIVKGWLQQKKQAQNMLDMASRIQKEKLA